VVRQKTTWSCEEQGWTHYATAQCVWFIHYQRQTNCLWRSTRIYEKLKELGCDPQYYPTSRYADNNLTYRRIGQGMDKGKHQCYDSRIGLRLPQRQPGMVQSYWATQSTYGQKFVLSSSLSNHLICDDLFWFEYRLEDSTSKVGRALHEPKTAKVEVGSVPRFQKYLPMIAVVYRYLRMLPNRIFLDGTTL
jgi:hypothetical protein